jgi:hypothetical protein
MSNTLKRTKLVAWSFSLPIAEDMKQADHILVAYEEVFVGDNLLRLQP